MAKANTGKARKLAGVRVDMPFTPSTVEGSLSTGHGERYRYVVRSDQTVLRSFQSAIFYTGQTPYWGSSNYKVIGRIKDDAWLVVTDDPSGWLAKFAQRKH